MSKAICTDAINGAAKVVARAEAMLAQAIERKGADHPVGFPGTAYFLPIIYSFTGKKVATLRDLTGVLQDCHNLLPPPPSEDLWLPYLGDTLDAGVATLFAFEVIEACKTLIGPPPVEGIWLGAANDVIMRERGVEFVDGTAPGFAAIVGAAPDAKTAVRIARELQEKNLYVFMCGSSPDRTDRTDRTDDLAVEPSVLSPRRITFAEQLASEGVQLGWETRLVPFGCDVSACVYALGFANRAALSFGGVAPGDFKRNLSYNKNRIFAFVLALGEVDEEKYAAAAGAINYGFPTIADTDIPDILPTGVCTYEHVVSNVPHDKIVEKALEVRGCKIKIAKVPIPVSYGAAFEGERIRKNDMHVQFGGNITPGFEYVTMVELEDIDDGRIDVIGPDIDAVEEGSALPLAIWVEVAGRKMQVDFEPILERQIHHLLNGAEGLWHMGQRDILWTRVSKAGFARGLRLRHYGEILHARFINDYPAIVDKVKVTLITEPAEVERRLEQARRVYRERNHRLAAMTDESVETFYSCLLCQSFAPNHVCIITPERLGLCGAYNWLDGKAAHEIDETGPNQPVQKGRCLDPVRGVWEGVNEYVYKNSHQSIEQFTAYSIMDHPMTSCGCFETIIAYVPECNGVMIVNREFMDDTPTGMTFSTLAGMVGGGVQTPGFMGVGKAFLASPKFLFADGGIGRVVWMPGELKKMIGADFQARAKEQGIPNLLDLIADETIATEPQAIRAHMEKIGHPALRMADMGGLWSEEAVPESNHRTDQTDRADDRTDDRTDLTDHPQDDHAQVEKSCANEPANLMATLLKSLSAEIKSSLIPELRKEIAAAVADALKTPHAEAWTQTKEASPPESQAAPAESKPPAPSLTPQTARPKARSAKEKFDAIKTFAIPKDRPGRAIERVRLGATGAEGGTRARSVLLGGQNCLPFHQFEGQIPLGPALALEVFDTVNPKMSPILREAWGTLLENPAEMARKAVQEFGADLISVRLEGTHPEKGGKSADVALSLVKEVLAAVDVPLIVTAHSHFETANEVMKKIAAGCAGERLLLNWVENQNYRTIAGVALAYGHCLVAQSPIDVNMSKQLNILLANMDLPRDRIVMDPMAGALGYGLEYTYSVMERIRLTSLGGDDALAFPMMVHAGQEAWKVKESSAPTEAFPAWGDLARRSVLWEIQTAMPLILSGADLVILHHPEALQAIRRNVAKLMRYRG